MMCPAHRNALDFTILTTLSNLRNTKAVWKVRGLAAVRRCYAEEGGDCYAKL
jgi:hypothetical protein